LNISSSTTPIVVFKWLTKKGEKNEEILQKKGWKDSFTYPKAN
jgi:hypothetical protein